MYVYILANKKNGTIYTGVTFDLIKRVWEHKQGITEGFTKKYEVKMLVYYEQFDDPVTAISREKQIKNWKREWKIKTINEFNPDWRDLFEEITK